MKICDSMRLILPQKQAVMTQILKSPEGIDKLMAELWSRHRAGTLAHARRIYMVDIPVPAAAELESQSRSSTITLSRDALTAALQKAAHTLGGW